MIAVVVVVLLLSVRAVATFWTDFLWFDVLDLAAVWRKLLSAKVTLGVGATLVFFVILWLNLLVADRIAPRFRPVAGHDDELLVRYRELVSGRQRVMEVVVALLIAAVPGLGAAGQWREWLLFRYGGNFGAKDPQFGQDIGFFVFRLPFLTQVVDWLFGFLVVTAIVVAVVHYLNGAIRVQPLGERVTPNAKAHLSVLLALAALVKAADYWLQRYELLYAPGRSFDGAGYTAVNARLPAIDLLILISLFAAVLLLVNIRRKGWALPAIVVSLWLLVALVVGSAYPAFVQRFQVGPAELAKEKPFIERNITATREALGLDDVQQTDFFYSPDLTSEKLAAQQSNLTNARLLDPSVIRPTIEDLEFGREFYAFRDVDVDRYVVQRDGAAPVREPTIVSTRELNTQGIAAPTWEKLHLVFTHGYAAAVAPANSVDGRGDPNFLVSNIPVKVTGLPPLERPELYHGEGMDGYSIVGTDQTELSTDQVTTQYEGKAGVPIDTLSRKAAFALRFGEIEPMISGNLTKKSKVIYVRDIKERVQTIAPYLILDEDPYGVLVDGRVKYVIDGYTASANFPYAESLDVAAVTTGATGSFNYLRNSVKAVVDAYDGTVDLYLVDTLYGSQDPIIRAWAKAFPGVYTTDIPESLSRHFRYPELLFKTQTAVWGRYHQGDPSSFFNNSDRWDVAQQPPNTSAGAAAADTSALVQPNSQLDRIEPYYQLMQLSPDSEPEFVLTRPFVLASSDDSARNLTAIMVASNDPGSYGKLRQIVMTSRGEDGKVERSTRVDGPLRANQKMVTYQPVSVYQTQVGSNGSRVQFGNLLILPFRDSLLYLRPVYAKEEQSGRFSLKRVVVTSGDSVGFGDSLPAALADLLDGDPDKATGAPSDAGGAGNGGGTAGTTTTTVPGEQGGDPTALLAQADETFSRADQKLRNGDLGGYQADVAAARALVARAAAALAEAPSAPTTAPQPAPAAGAPTTTTTTPATPTTVAPVGRT